MQKVFYSLLLLSVYFRVAAQTNDPTKNLLIRQNHQKFLKDQNNRPTSPTSVIQYHSDFYRMDSIAAKNLRVEWLDGMKIYDSDQLPSKLKALNRQVQVLHLDDSKHPGAFDSLKRNLKFIRTK